MRTPPTPQILLFDLGGVLIENVTFEELPTLLAEPMEAAALYDRWLESDAVRRYERGQISTEEFGFAFTKEWNLNVSPQSFLAEFAGWPKGPYEGAVALLTRLRERFTIAFLSNCNETHWKRLCPILSHGNHAFSSHLLGMVKPDPDIFAQVIRELDCEPDTVCFFDDSLKNVQAAQAAGMQAYRTLGFAELEKAVALLG